MCNSPHLMLTNSPLPVPSQLVFTSAAALKKRSDDNEKLIGHLQRLLSAQKIELSLLRATASKNSLLSKRTRSSPSATSAPSTPPHSPHFTHPFPTPPTASVSDIPNPKNINSSPRDIMFSSFHSSPMSSAHPAPAPAPAPAPSAPHLHNLDHTHREMAARGSHWSFIEKARFEAALHKHGSFAWDQLIRAVGSRTEKQVKAYAARYRRRKKLAAAMQHLPFHIPPPPAQPTPAAPHAPVQIAPAAPNPSHVTDYPEVPTDPELSDFSQSDAVSSGHSSPLEHDDVGFFGQELNGYFGHDLNRRDVVDTSKYINTDLLDDAILGSTCDDAGLLSDDPSDVDLLVDRAMDDQIFPEEDSKPVLIQLSEDLMLTDFLSSLFTNS